MKIRTLWGQEDEETPWLLAAVDELAEEYGGVLWEEFEKQRREWPTARELVLEVPTSEIEKLFTIPTVKAKVAKEAKEK